jgi:hypothetical protein
MSSFFTIMKTTMLVTLALLILDNKQDELLA